MILKQKDAALDNLESVLHRESWEWLVMNQPSIASSLESAIFAGNDIDSIKRVAWSATERPEIVKRIEAAAKWLITVDMVEA
ncbi:MAG: hypothetical protein M9918_13175 [Anaerolineae bacterium]|nr:hypothetical protein [Anaerolineae bacterium]